MTSAFSMPRDRQLCLDPSRRAHVRREPGPRFPFPVPNGWFIVATAAELAPGDIRPVHYFGRDLVVYRTAGGEPRVVDAYCAHLGAHLGVGGRVDGANIVCPFHGWCYDGASGACVDIPYAGTDKVPSKARVRAYPAIERNGMVWAWHHLQGGEPFYEVPVVDEFASDEWLPPVLREFEVATCCQEMAENNHDFAHFKYVHGTDEIVWDSHVIEGHYKRADARGGRYRRESFGLGLGVLRLQDRFTFLSSTTPIDEEHVHVRWVFTTPASQGPGGAETIADMLLDDVSQDIPIWENKAYRPRPVLTKEEKGIALHRDWCEQFYSRSAG